VNKSFRKSSRTPLLFRKHIGDLLKVLSCSNHIYPVMFNPYVLRHDRRLLHQVGKCILNAGRLKNQFGLLSIVLNWKMCAVSSIRISETCRLRFYWFSYPSIAQRIRIRNIKFSVVIYWRYLKKSSAPDFYFVRFWQRYHTDLFVVLYNLLINHLICQPTNNFISYEISEVVLPIIFIDKSLLID